MIVKLAVNDSPDGPLPNQNTTIIINIIWYYFTRNGKKYNEILLQKNDMDLDDLKKINPPPSVAQGDQ